jgi:catechol 2,3-dioxygenase-like lactoylglutathione lyase family enzyme
VAVSLPPRVVSRIARVSLTTAAPGATAAFFRSALGFVERGVEERAGEDFVRLMGLPGDAPAQVRLLCLGRQQVEFVAFAEMGRPYPPGSTSCDPWFQHMAIVVADMRAAYARLAAQPGWTPISTAGPQRLLDSSGGVTAFSFRDPGGHPLELLEFPPHRAPTVWRESRGGDPCLGIDHSAIVVADTAASVAFYGALGFRVCGGSLNRGAEQERLWPDQAAPACGAGRPRPPLSLFGADLQRATPFSVNANEADGGGGGLELWAADEQGRTTMTAKAGW